MSLDAAVQTASGGDVSVADVSAVTGLSASLIYREIERGNLPAYRVGRRLRIERGALVAWKERCRVRPRYEPPIYEPLAPGGPTSRRASSSVFAAELASIEARGRGAG